MITVSFPAIDKPRISANQLGEFPFATPAKKLQMLTDQKFGNDFRAPYYQCASCTLLRAFDDEGFDEVAIMSEIVRLRSVPPRNPNHAAKLLNNALMLERFLAITSPTVPGTGRYDIIRRNATFELDDITISVRPEILTRNTSTGFFALTKFRFSKSKVSADSSEIILLLLLKYAQGLNFPGLHLDPAETRLVDCFSLSVIPAHTLPRIRERQLQDALREIRRLWPTLRRPDAFPSYDHN